MAPKLLEGFVGDGAGEPLDAIAATVTKVADGSVVTTGATDADGHWAFSGLAVGDEYFVTLEDGAGRAVVRGPWSGELREVWVRDRLDMPTGATAVLPSRATAYLGALPLGPADLTDGAGALDYRYVNTAGDTMTGPLVVPALTVGGMAISQAALDSRYVNTAGDTMTGALALPSLTVGGNDISYSSLDARYVNTSGDAMTGTLAGPSLTVAGVAINQTTLDTRYVNVTGDTMSGALTLPRGSAAAPPLAFDAGTGVYSAGEDQLNLATAGVQRLSVEASGELRVYGFLQARANQPTFGWYDANEASVDERSWQAHVDSKVWSLRLLTDAGSAGADALQVVRGTGTAISTFRLTASGAASGWAIFDFPTKSLTLAGPLYQSAAYAYLGAYNASGVYPRAGADLAIGWNFTSGFRDMGLWNTDTANTTGISFVFRQLLAGNTRRDLAILYADGRVSAINAVLVTPPSTNTPMLGVNTMAGAPMIGFMQSGSGGVLYASAATFPGSSANSWGTAPVAANRRLPVMSETGTLIGYLPLYATS
jgi:hypothetical protein